MARYVLVRYTSSPSAHQAEEDACDLTQQTFYVWATKGHQLGDPSKVKTWAFTTLHRRVPQSRRRYKRFPHMELSEADSQLPSIRPSATLGASIQLGGVIQALAQIDKVLYRARSRLLVFLFKRRVLQGDCGNTGCADGNGEVANCARHRPTYNILAKAPGKGGAL